MSLNNELDLVSGSFTNSIPSQQPSQSMTVNNHFVTNKHLSYAQIRGVIQIFNYHFPKNGKRMNKSERNKRWLAYKNKILQDYGRVITGKLASEKAYIKRYSKPLDFLKYKLKRVDNLKLEDLPTQADRDYYFEIGGFEDVDALISQTYDINMDSVQRISNNFENYNNNRKRRRIDTDLDQDDDLNHNRNIDISQQLQHNNQEIEICEPINNDSSLMPPPVSKKRKLKIEKMQRQTHPFSILRNRLDVFEQEQLDKKKIEMFEITKQKLAATKSTMHSYLINDPHLIGCIPGVENQAGLAFDCWLNTYKEAIMKDEAIKNQLELFLYQLTLIRSDMTEWNNFISTWKLYRIFYKDNFQIVWNKIKNELDIDTPSDKNEQ